MGVDRTDYLMMAVDIGYDNFDYDKHEDEINGSPDARFDIVYDGMCGEYCLAGKIIARADAYDGFGQTKIEPASLAIDKNQLAATIADAFGKPVAPDDLALHLFSHFS